jgi:hypothetical protein
LRAAQALRTAEIAAKLPKRLHPVSDFADYRKAANDDGSAAACLAGANSHCLKCPLSSAMTKM